MELWLLILYAVFLLLVISVASEFLAKGAMILEHRFGSGFVGSVILGFVTMLPELIFVLVAINAGEVDIAVGSAVGGNILLFTIGYGFVIILAYVKHGEIITLKPTMRDDLWYLIISAFYLLIASLDQELTLFDGIVLTLMYFVFVIHQLIESRRLDETGQTHEISKKKWIRSASFMGFGAIAIVIAAEPFVHNITDISVEVGYPL